MALVSENALVLVLRKNDVKIIQSQPVPTIQVQNDAHPVLVLADKHERIVVVADEYMPIPI